MSKAEISGRTRLFKNGWLERLTVISAAGFASLWIVLLPAIALTGAVSAPSRWAVPLAAFGVVVWTATEYALHRYIFHFEPRSEVLKRAIFVIHGNHHADPNDPLRNLMPPVVSLPVGGAVWLLSLWMFGLPGTWFFFGWMLGYVAYDLVHYACHQWPMKGRFARTLKTHHMRHHHSRALGNYAITGMVWDRLLATRIGSARERG